MCRGCGAELDGCARLLCPACRQIIAAPLPAAWREACTLGDGELPRFARLPYDGPAGAAVRLLKCAGKKKMAALLAAGLASLAAELKKTYHLDAMVPVPLHPLRRRERRFNQAEEVGRLVAVYVGVELCGRGLVRTRHTRPQVDLKGEERLANVRGAFAARGDFSGKRILLIDDVITTGATMSECGRVLREAGAEVVISLAAAAPGLAAAT